MPPTRIQTLFLVLMGASLICAFVLPQETMTRQHPQISMLFAPVSHPSAAIASIFFHHFGGDRSEDPRDLVSVRAENEELRTLVKSLSAQVADLSQREAEKEQLGDIGQLCVPVAVAGADSGVREALLLRTSTLEGIEEGMFVIYRGGLVGKIEGSGVAGAQVLLETDPGFRVRGSFATFTRDSQGRLKFVRLRAPTVLAEGSGKNSMLVQVLTMEETRQFKIVPGTSLVVSEPDWPLAMQGQPLGKVVDVSPRPDAPLYANIRIEPEEYLKRLREVMVVTKVQ